MRDHVALAPVDAAHVTILVDNHVDALLAGTDVAQRPALRWDQFDREQLRAEHGYALPLTVRMGEREYSVLYDAGLGRGSVLRPARLPTRERLTRSGNYTPVGS